MRRTGILQPHYSEHIRGDTWGRPTFHYFLGVYLKTFKNDARYPLARVNTQGFRCYRRAKELV